MKDRNSLVSLWTRGWERDDPLWLFKFVGFFGAGGVLLYAAGLFYNGEHNVPKAIIALLVAVLLIATPLVGIRKARQP